MATISNASLNEGATMHSHGVVRGSSGLGTPQTAVLPSLALTDTFSLGYIVAGVEYVLVPLVDVSTTFHEPTVSAGGGTSIVLGATDFATTFAEQAINARNSVIAPIFDASTTIHTPIVVGETDSGEWIYRPPTLGEIFLHMRRFPISFFIGVTVIVNGDSYTVTSTPTTRQLADADSFFLGGRDHIVTSEQKTALEASGIGGSFTPVLGSGE